jgi:hypothetical protein
MADQTNIYTKLLAFQKLGISIRKDKKNPHFRNDYASINEVLDKVKPELSKLIVNVTVLKYNIFNHRVHKGFILRTQRIV